MTKLEIYTQNGCSYCTRAKTLYISKQEMFPEYVEYNISESEVWKNRLKNRVPDVKTVPQIFINDKHIGGYDEFCDWIDNHYSGS
jgi:glutaredoxin